MRRLRIRLAIYAAIIAVAYAAQWRYVGWSPRIALLAKSVTLSLPDTIRRPIIIGSQQVLPLEACLRDADGRKLDCASEHPRLFSFDVQSPWVIDVGPGGSMRTGQAGHFKIAVRALGHVSSLVEGEVIPEVKLRLPANDVVMEAGDDIQLGWRVARLGTMDEPPASGVELEPIDAVSARITLVEPIAWAYPGGVRITALAPGRACFKLTGAGTPDWLRIIIVDSLQRTVADDGRTVTRDEIPGCPGGPPPGAPCPRCGSLLFPAYRSARPDSAVRRFFVLARCIDVETRVAGHLLVGDEGIQVMARCVEHAPDSLSMMNWRVQSFDGSTYPYFRLDLAQVVPDRDSTFAFVSFDGGKVIYQDTVANAKRVLATPMTLVSGDETQLAGAIRACALLHERQVGTIPSTIDSIVGFAHSRARARAIGERDPDGCEYRLLPIKDNTDRQIVRYTVSRNDFTIVVRPSRYGESGILSVLAGRSRQMWMTYEDRDPTFTDRQLVAPKDSWAPWTPK
ncbi:MAG TPA: hypothetical protein VFI52_01485 [Gemmatimonadaceae bacterium]|nr:hypothetical protein [Gemmatimonadaceae bacterium]